MKAALELAYPAWLSVPQIKAICFAIEPRYAEGNDDQTRRTLSRFHSYRQVDRIGVPIYRAKTVFEKVQRPVVLVPGGGYKYRLRREARDFL